jgi:hypothetical protein
MQKVDVTFEITVSIDSNPETLLIPPDQLFGELSDEEVNKAVTAVLRRVMEYGIGSEDISEVSFYSEEE